MKIAILTFPLRENYGGVLQCYALQTILQRMGHEVEVIKWSASFVFSFRGVLKGIYKKLLSKISGKDEFVRVRLEAYIRHRRIIRFIKDKIIFTSEEYYYKNDLERLSDSDFDVFIVGSDQVWRSLFMADSWIDLYFLSFLKMKDKKRIAYSASFGVDHKEYTDELVVRCGDLFSHFDAVSVREDSGLELIEEYHWKCKRDSIQTLDPAMLLNKDDYIHLFHLNMEQYGINLFAYLLDVQTEANRILEQIALEKGLKIIRVQSIEKSLGFRSLFALPSLSPVQWVEHIASSHFVVTDSFHGCVYSILFHKPFIVVGNTVRGNARISSLLRLVQLEYRFVSSQEDFEQRKKILLEPVDYRDVELILDEKRAMSLDFLNTAINY
ncbi:polysaccharide pyruvyl transferase family protein [uncultured Bacteroides sp.]|jgi:hypothetical protein|uniref:polysaccharide pyruvyl transferase family protein n=1 Tax=uncultured Bacteroides sp. TaxID=162156 RepID=UPI00258C8EC4|nr:polysaccharide pyruvyl transferase family protein [uncultured Bacteroides sp.]